MRPTHVLKYFPMNHVTLAKLQNPQERGHLLIEMGVPEMKRSLEVLGILFLSVFVAGEGLIRQAVASSKDVSREAGETWSEPAPLEVASFLGRPWNTVDPAALSPGRGVGQGQIQTPWFCPEQTPKRKIPPSQGGPNPGLCHLSSCQSYRTSLLCVPCWGPEGGGRGEQTKANLHGTNPSILSSLYPFSKPPRS